MVELMTTFWVQVPTPALDGAQSPVALMREYTSWLTAVVGIFSILIAAGRMALSREGRTAADSAKGLLHFVLLSSAGVAALSLLVEFGDEYSKWVIDKSAGGDLAKTLVPLTTLTQLISPLGSFVVLILALLGIFSALGQLGLMFIRSGILIILAGMFSLVGAAGINSGGRQTRDKVVAWALAFAFYKPVAATGYAGAFLATGKGSDVATKISGIFLIFIAILALPALMRVLTPAVSAVTSSGSGGGAAGGAVASGAVQMVGGMSRSSSGSAPSGASNGSNPSGAGLVGANGRNGSAGSAGTQGSEGSAQSGAAGAAGAKSAAGAQGASGAAAGGASGGAAAGAAGGPVGAGIGAAISAGTQATGAIKQAAQKAADQEGS
ncbi:hypothetical protein SAMN04488074_13615 [Lentzea albidocapillata subsp. violacea]|uniref:TrbL/VirB6 plasmid conjugal transfer protein n=2 Tax=Lentzea albidocapillata TaxID=40571 RepID=A0A1G9YY82_9PSEU|nr:hypothetical protein SAMN04488074_13615 [Lentzea albidocapillata subsp. violacea]